MSIIAEKPILNRVDKTVIIEYNCIRFEKELAIRRSENETYKSISNSKRYNISSNKSSPSWKRYTFILKKT
jgi:hypothetical protein